MENKLDLNPLFKNILKGKKIVVTGAYSGLGKAICYGLAFTGAKLCLIDLNENLSRFAKELDALFDVVSVTDDVNLEKSYEKFGKIDGLINCAGFARLGSINELNPKDIKLTNDVNINGYFLNALFASKKISSGAIINISSASARAPSANSSLYSVAKEAQCAMVRSWALDLGNKGIRVNAILAGDLFGDEKINVYSNIWNQEYFEKKAINKKLVDLSDPRLGKKELNPEIKQLVIDYYVKRTTLSKKLEYCDVLNLIIFLLSDLGAKITGESISITSGNPAVFSR